MGDRVSVFWDMHKGLMRRGTGVRQGRGGRGGGFKAAAATEGEKPQFAEPVTHACTSGILDIGYNPLFFLKLYYNALIHK